jgi:hypothetical protein
MVKEKYLLNPICDGTRLAVSGLRLSNENRPFPVHRKGPFFLLKMKPAGPD